MAKYYVEEKLAELVSVKDFGATGNGTTDDTAAIQACLTAAAIASRRVFFPGGQYKVTDTLQATQVGTTFQSCFLQGEVAAFSNIGSLIDGSTILGKPVINVQHYGGAHFADLTILGPNQTPNGVNFGAYRLHPITGTAAAGSTTTLTLPSGGNYGWYADSFFVGWTLTATGGAGAGQQTKITGYVKSTRVATFAAVSVAFSNTTTFSLQCWVAPGVRDSRYSPQCGICLGGGRGATPADGGYAGFTYQNSSGSGIWCTFTRVFFHYHVVGILISPDQGANNEWGSVQDCNFNGMRCSVAACHSQSRNWTITGGGHHYVGTVIDGNRYGLRQGSVPKITGMEVGPGFEIFNASAAFDQVVIDKVRGESIHRLGYSASPAAQNHPTSIVNSAIKLLSHAVYGLGPGLAAYCGAGGLTIRDSLIGNDTASNNVVFFYANNTGSVILDNVSLEVFSLLESLTFRTFDDSCPVQVRNCRVYGINDGTFSKYGSSDTTEALPARILVNDTSLKYTRNGAYKVALGNIAGTEGNGLWDGSTAYSLNASNMTYTTTLDVVRVGDYLAVSCSIPTASDDTTTAPVTFPCFRVTAKAGAAVTADFLINRDYLPAATDPVYLWIQEWAPPADVVCQCTTTSASTNLTSCTAGLQAALRAGDFIKGAGIAQYARVVSVGATTVISIAATASASNVDIYMAKLAAI